MEACFPIKPPVQQRKKTSWFLLVNIPRAYINLAQRYTSKSILVLLSQRSFSSVKMAASDNVIVIENDGHFQSEMAKAGAKLVVVDFTASW